jgi:heterodisulfide reductase subunit C
MISSENHIITSQIKDNTGVDVNLCYQCGKCTAGCVLADDMDYPSSYIMRLLQTNEEGNYLKVLSSNAIWLCVNCENCIGRCPKEVDIPVVMDYLRAESVKRKLVSSKAKPVLSFYKSFLGIIKSTGRLNEVFMTISYKMRTFRLWQDVKLVPSMLLKGKLKFWPDSIKRRSDISAIFRKTNSK